ncbi:MAG: DUF2007 domain-containing protein [Acidobacteria bacterium]|nr:MAG: DUF2007 domain-containing protein [Acidobacteriota bacterium]
MYCPLCGAEHRLGSDRCAECNFPLVPDFPAAVEHPDPDMVTVYETADAALLPIIKSVLDGAGIPYIVQGDETTGLFPLGPLSTGLYGRGVAALVRVPRQHLAAARELLVAQDDVPTDRRDGDEASGA